MEPYWQKKRIFRILKADSEVVDEFLDNFAPAIYTWMYYQTEADEAIALDLTEQTLLRSIEHLPEYNPAQETFYQWLKEQAKQVRDEGLLHLQLKPQRPWAWSQLTETVLYSLSRIRQENLLETVCNDPSIQQIVKASLSEMSMPDRELMMHRYNHLDTPEHIAEEMAIELEEIEDRLYRCRHSFKRIFIQIVAACNAGFAESNTTAEMEVLDGNLEKLLSATDINEPMKTAQLEKLRVKLHDAAKKIAAELIFKPSSAHKAAIVGLIMGAGVIVILAVVLIMVLKKQYEPVPTPAPPTPPTAQEETPPTVPAEPQPSPEEVSNEEIQKIFALGSAGDIDALIEVLRSGRKINQLTAAILLGQFGDLSAIEPLIEAEQQWYPNGPDTNPFRTAIDSIFSRYPEETEVIDEDIPDEETPIEPSVSPVDTEPNNSADIPPAILESTISGVILDPSGNPQKANIALIQNLSDPLNQDGQTIASVESDTQGLFTIAKDFYGLAFLRATLQTGLQSKTITRAVWGQPNKQNKTAFTGRPLLMGSISSNSTQESSQTLYLCDALDPENAAYIQETQTDDNGDFEFWSVPPGAYSLFRVGFDNRLYRLAQVEMPPTNAHRINLSVDPLQVIVELQQQADEEDPLPVILDAQLSYGPNLPERLNRYEGIVTEENFIIFDDVMPGNYLLRMQIADGVWVHQIVEVFPDVDEQLIDATFLPLPDTVLSGRLLNPSPIDLFLTNLDRSILIDLIPDPDGVFEVTVPRDIYQLVVVIQGETVELDVVDLQEQSEFVWDIDPAKLLSTHSGLYVQAIDENGFVISGAQVILNAQNMSTISITGKNGAFFAPEPGKGQITVLRSEIESIEQDITIPQSKLPSKPTAQNTILINFGQ